MGFERLCMAMQNTTSNYDTDVLHHLSKSGGNYRIEIYFKLCKRNEVKNKNKTNIAIRVIVDHVRAVAFAIDGRPSNTGAGYVIRRILRRAIRYGFTFEYQRTLSINW
jgi:alanyl-tRNA synthetase